MDVLIHEKQAPGGKTNVKKCMQTMGISFASHPFLPGRFPRRLPYTSYALVKDKYDLKGQNRKINKKGQKLRIVTASIKPSH